MALWGFFDESGEHGADDKLTRLTLGGFFAPYQNVERLRVLWREALEGEGLREFHMMQSFSDEAQYDRWDEARQNRLDRFVRILCDCMTDIGAFSYAVQPRKPSFKKAYKLALNRAMMVFSSHCDKADKPESIMFAQTQEVKKGLIGDYFDKLGWEEYLDQYIVASSSEEPALQAAEIVARGMKRLMQDGGVTRSFGMLMAHIREDRQGGALLAPMACCGCAG